MADHIGGVANGCLQLIELWETYLLQLDSDEDGPPLMPAGVVADPDPKSEAQLRREAATAQLNAEHDDEQPLPGGAGDTGGFGQDEDNTGDDVHPNEIET